MLCHFKRSVPLFYIIYTNDIRQGLLSNVALYADDTVLYSKAKKTSVITLNLQKDKNGAIETNLPSTWRKSSSWYLEIKGQEII